MKHSTLLFLVSEDWYFCSHRLSIARAAATAGWHVVVATRVREHGDVIRSAGLELAPIEFHRSDVNPLANFLLLLRLIRLYRNIRPNLVHHVALKPVLYGSAAAYAVNVPRIVNAMTGLGFVFRSSHWRAIVLRTLLAPLLRLFLNGSRSHLIVQNPDDKRVLAEAGIGRDENTVLIQGSGVDITHFIPSPEPPPPVTVTLVSRLLWDKGVGEFVSAVALLKQRGLNFRAIVVGAPDPLNPQSISDNTLKSWENEGMVEFWGHRSDIFEVWRQSHIGVLPSHAEGLPKSLLEAAACARPLVTTDAPGCRELVTEEVNGLLVPVGDVKALADALATLIESPDLRQGMGENSRRLVEEHFSENIIVRKTLALYQRLQESL